MVFTFSFLNCQCWNLTTPFRFFFHPLLTSPGAEEGFQGQPSPKMFTSLVRPPRVSSSWYARGGWTSPRPIEILATLFNIAFFCTSSLLYRIEIKFLPVYLKIWGRPPKSLFNALVVELALCVILMSADFRSSVVTSCNKNRNACWTASLIKRLLQNLSVFGVVNAMKWLLRWHNVSFFLLSLLQLFWNAVRNYIITRLSH